MNEHDSERLSGLLENAGYIATDSEDADVVVYNTCAVRENADNKLYGNLGMLYKTKEKRPGMQIAVGGCLAQKDKELIQEKAPWVDVVFGTHNFGSLPVLLERARVNQEAQIEILEALEVFPSNLPTKRDSIHSALVAISVGCNNTCTFCIVPSLRGKEKDRRAGEILDEIKTLVSQGVIEIMLLGQNVNSYGVEFGDKYAFGKLLRACGNIQGLERVRFISPHPKDFTDDVISAMAETSNVMPHLHMPLQSGSDKVLADMKAHTHHVLSSEDGSGNDKHAQAARNIRQKYSISHDIHEEYQSDEQFIASWKEGMKEDVDALFADDSTISEDFKSKAATIFEARVTDRVQQIEESIESKYAGMLEEAVQAIQADLTEKVDDYLNYVVEQWMEENQIAIESSLRSEITEDFISGLRGLFAEHYIDVPEDKVDLVDELAGQVEDLETKLNEEIQRGIEAKKALVESVKKEITHEVCEGLTDTQVEKIKSLAESVEFSTEDEYKSKLETIRENYFPSGVKKADEKQLHEEIETDETKAVATDAFVAAVSKAITRTTVK